MSANLFFFILLSLFSFPFKSFSDLSFSFPLSLSVSNFTFVSNDVIPGVSVPIIPLIIPGVAGAKCVGTRPNEAAASPLLGEERSHAWVNEEGTRGVVAERTGVAAASPDPDRLEEEKLVDKGRSAGRVTVFEPPEGDGAKGDGGAFRFLCVDDSGEGLGIVHL